MKGQLWHGRYEWKGSHYVFASVTCRFRGSVFSYAGGAVHAPANTRRRGETMCVALYTFLLCVCISVCVSSKGISVHDAGGLNAPAPARAHPWDGFRINGKLQWINGEGLASRQAAQGRRGWAAGRGRKGFILSRNAFKWVSWELELPSCTPEHWIGCRRIAGDRANYTTRLQWY